MSKFDIDGMALVDALPEALLITSDIGEIAYVNTALCLLTGFSNEDLVGEPVSLLMPTGERERIDVVSWFAKWAKDPSAHSLRFLTLDGITKAGEKLRFRVRVSTFNRDGIVYFLVVLQDTTAEYKETLGLRHSQLLSNRILAIGEDAVMTIDEVGIVQYWNQKAEAVFGYSASEIIGESFELLIPTKFSSQHRLQVKAFIEGKLASKLMGERSEIKGQHKQGHIIPLEAAITKTTIEGRLLISAQIRDITQRKLAEQLLHEKEAHFRAIFEHAVEAMALLSVHGRILEINSAALALLPKDEMTDDQCIWDLNWWHQTEDLPARREELKQTIELVAQGNSLRTRATLSGTGSERNIDFSLTAVHGKEDQIIYIIAEGRDLTALGEQV